MTEILLGVTNAEIASIAKEVILKEKSKRGIKCKYIKISKISISIVNVLKIHVISSAIPKETIFDILAF